MLVYISLVADCVCISNPASVARKVQVLLNSPLSFPAAISPKLKVLGRGSLRIPGSNNIHFMYGPEGNS